MVFDKVKDIIVEQLGVDEEEVKMEASFIDDLGADSSISSSLSWLLKKNSIWKYRIRKQKKSQLSVMLLSISKLINNIKAIESPAIIWLGLLAYMD